MANLGLFVPLSAQHQLPEPPESDKLQRLWHERSAVWEIRAQNAEAFRRMYPEMIRFGDSLSSIRLMGFDLNAHPIYYQTSNLFSAGTINTSSLWAGGLSELNLMGQGISLHLWDGGAVRHAHQEFNGRTQQYDGAVSINGHATHVAGTMVSSGMVPTARGMAPEAQLHVYDFGDDEIEMTEAAAQGALLSNHSYGRATGWLFHTNQWWWHGDTRVSTSIDYKFGFYDHETRVRDEIAYFAPYYLQVHAAGNDRADSGPAPGEEHNVFDHSLNQWVKSSAYREPDGGPDGYDCISSLVLGKNVLTIGSVADVLEYTGPESVQLSEFSSTGPADDGRIKPDLVANGQGVLSTWVNSNDSYASLSGTSMAAPAITGSLGLLQELYHRMYGSYMRAATLRAVAIHSAREAGQHPGPDYRHGWGLADMEAAAELIKNRDVTTVIQERNLVQNSVPEYTRMVWSTGNQPLVATLAWTDVPGDPREAALNDRTPLLVNDLDLRITRISDGQVFYPWMLNPDEPSAPAFTGDNLVDNVEKIEIMFPEPGQYRVSVTHKGEIVDLINTTNKRQPFSLVVTGIAERALDLATLNVFPLVSGCAYSAQTPMRAIIKNTGQQAAENFQFHFQIRDHNQVLIDQGSLNIDLLEAGLQAELAFTADLSQGFHFFLSGTVQITGDQYPPNNSFHREIISDNWVVSQQTYHASFEQIIYVEQIGWSTLNVNQDESGWAVRVSSVPSQWASDGLNSVRYGQLSPDPDNPTTPAAADDWLITGCFYLFEGETYRLRFDYRSWNDQSPESMRLMMGQGANAEALNTELLDLPSFAMNAFETGEVLFQVEEDGTYFFGFHVYSPENHHFIYLDNVFLERMVYHDLHPGSLVVEAGGCDFSSQTPVRLSFENAGMNAQHNFDIQLELTHNLSGQSQILTHTWSAVIEPGESAEHVFYADMSLSGRYKLLFTTLLEGDERPENDSLATTVINTSTLLAEEDFFTNFDYLSGLAEIGWSVHSNSEQGTGWRYYSVPGQAYSPPNSLNMYRWENIPPDDWAFSNCLIMEEGTHYRVKFYTATQGAGSHEEFSVHLMSDALPEAEVEMLGHVVITNNEYIVKEFEFQAPYSGQFYIGLYTDFTGPDVFQIFVDDFSVEKVLEKDMAVSAVLQDVWGCESFTQQTPFRVVVQNRGYLPTESFELEIDIEHEDGSLQSQQHTFNLSLGLSQRDTLSFHADLSQSNSLYEIRARVIFPDDEDASNNLARASFWNTTANLAAGDVYFTDFELYDIDGGSQLVDPRSGWHWENTNNDFYSPDDPITWTQRKNASFALSGQMSVRSGRSATDASDDWLFSNCMLLEEGENYLVSFHYTGRMASATEEMSLFLGSAQHSASMEHFLWHRSFSTAIDYRKGVVAFTAPYTGIWHLGFHAHSDVNQGWIYMDDVTLMKNHDIDLSLDNIEVLAEVCEFSQETPIRIHFRNSGNQALDHPLHIHWQITGPAGQITQQGEWIYQDALAVNQHLFAEVTADLRLYGIYRISASISLAEGLTEAETGNNHFETEVFSTALNPEAGNLYLSFEEFTEFEQTGWTALDVNQDNFKWNLGVNYTTYSFSGNRVMYYTFNPSQPANDYLFSGCANLMADTLYVVSYYTRVYDADYPEKIRFGLASDIHPDAVLQVFETVEQQINYQYRRVMHAFTVEQDGQYYFFWHAQSPKYHRYIFVDDFALRKALHTDAYVHELRATVPGLEFSGQTPLSIELRNLGREALPDGNLQLLITNPLGEQSQMQLSSPALPRLGQFTLNAYADMNLHGRYNVQYTWQIEGEQDQGSNQGSRNLFHTRLELNQPGSWYIQDFETIFALREVGWSIHNLNQDNRYWGLRVNDPGLAFSGHNYLVYFTGNTTQPANDWVISDGYLLEGNRPYKAAFYYRLGSGTHSIRLSYGNTAEPAALNQLIWQSTSLQAPDHTNFMKAGDVFVPDESGIYHFGIQQFSIAGQGSSIMDDLVIIARPDILSPGGPFEPGETIQLQALGTDSLAWFADAGLSQLLGRGPSLAYTIEGTDNIDIYAAEYVYGVMGPADMAVISLTTGLAEEPAGDHLLIYPNPVNDKLVLFREGISPERARINIFSTGGRLLFSFEWPAGDQVLEVEMPGLKPGVYHVRIQENKKIITRRFIKL